MTKDTFQMIMKLDKIPEHVSDEALQYAYQSGIELKFTPHPTQEDLDMAIAESYARGYKAAYDKIKAAL